MWTWPPGPAGPYAQLFIVALLYIAELTIIVPVKPEHSKRLIVKNGPVSAHCHISWPSTRKKRPLQQEKQQWFLIFQYFMELRIEPIFTGSFLRVVQYQAWLMKILLRKIKAALHLHRFRSHCFQMDPPENLIMDLDPFFITYQNSGIWCGKTTPIFQFLDKGVKYKE